MPIPTFDLSLYLVTDSGLLPAGQTLAQQVHEALSGGATIVQLREKTLNTRAFIELGRELHQITQSFGVPLLINDRIDVALAVGCEGVHIGWDDCDYADARRILGDDKIIGLSVSDETQAEKAAATGCDYLGIGPVFATSTKPDHNPALGTPGLRSLLEHISTLQAPKDLRWGRDVPVVAIGGINLTNVGRVLYQSKTNEVGFKSLSGVAVVSAIIGSSEACTTCKSFRRLLSTAPRFAQSQLHLQQAPGSSAVRRVIERVAATKPMIHHITNNVVKNFSANVTLAVGASPIMSEDLSELPELATYNGALVLNMGTSDVHAHPLLLAAVAASNAHGNPVVFDPVGAGATSLRRATTRLIVASGYCDVIKGNEAEIRTVFGEAGVQQQGVDSSAIKGSGLMSKAELVRALAQRERNIVVMTGECDFISDGESTYTVRDGHRYQGLVTGTGCSLGSVIAACVAVHREEKMLAVLAAVIWYNSAARVAAGRGGVVGPGSWLPVFLDCLNDRSDAAFGNLGLIS